MKRKNLFLATLLVLAFAAVPFGLAEDPTPTPTPEPGTGCTGELEEGDIVWCIEEIPEDYPVDECRDDDAKEGEKVFIKCHSENSGEFDGGNRYGEDYNPDDACDSLLEAFLNVGECGVLSMMGGEGSSIGGECTEPYKFKVCSYLANLPEEKAFVGAVCTDKGYGCSMGGGGGNSRPKLNLPPCEENPAVSGAPTINAGMIPGLKKQKFESDEEVEELNTSLLECPEEGGVDVANYENMAEYVDTTVLYYENFLKFFKDLDHDFNIIYTAVKKQCKKCESDLESFVGKYAMCGMPELEMDDLPAPSICWNLAKPFCQRGHMCNEGSEGQAQMVTMCPMCIALPCNWGKECELGVPEKSEDGKGSCWTNENLCGTDDGIGSSEDNYGMKGCDAKPDHATVEMGGCCIPPQINEQPETGFAAGCEYTNPESDSADFDCDGIKNSEDDDKNGDRIPDDEQTPDEANAAPPPPANYIYQYKDQACYQQSQCKIIAEAWRSLVTEKSKTAMASPAGVRECEKKLADLRDICELDKEGEEPAIACEVEKNMKKVKKYLDNLKKQMPKAIAQLKEVGKKFQSSIDSGASFVEIKKNLDELVVIMENLDKLEKSADEEDLDTDKFQKLLTKLVKFFQMDELERDLTKKHSWNAVACKLKDEGAELAFPGGTHKNLRYKGDGPEKWGAFCNRFNVIPGGETAAGNEQAFAMMMMMMQQNTEGTPIIGCGGYRGGCNDKPEMFHWKDQNMDEWGEVHMEALEQFQEIDVREMFVDSGECFKHKIPTVSMCEDICKQCHGTSVAHCHAQLGLCVCRLGTERKITGYECQESMVNGTDRAKFQACCEDMFIGINAPSGKSVTYQPNTTYGTAKRQCVIGMDENCIFDRELCQPPNYALTAGPLFDYCQTTNSESGLCCSYGFEEKAITYNCVESASCRRACQERFGGNQQRVDACTGRCMNADVSCEQECLDKFTEVREQRKCIYECWKEQEDLPDQTIDCIRDCQPDTMDPKVQDVCQRMCKATAPQLDVRLSVLRGESEVTAFYAGEEVRFKATIDNNGFLPFRGRAEVKLKLFDECDCPPCPEGTVCECACEDRYSAILATINVPLIEAEDAVILLSDPKPVDAELAGKTVQPLIELYNDKNKLIRTTQGPISKVLEMGKVAIEDAYFTVDGERATRAHTGSMVKGTIEVTSALFPLTISVSMVDAEERELEGSKNTVEVSDLLDGSLLETGEIETPSQYVGFVIRLHVEAIDKDNNTIISETLMEQGLASDACAGEVMTSWCLKSAVDFRMDYPDAYLEIRRPELKLNTAVFETKEGMSTPVLYEPVEVRVSVDLADIATIPFDGTVTISALDSWSVAVEGSTRTIDVSLLSRDETTVWSEYFIPESENTYVIMVQAMDNKGREWAIVPSAAGLVSSDLFPMARLEVREKSLVQGESNFIYQTISYGDCNIMVACEDCLPTCTLWLHRKSCTVRSDPGTCACECISSST